MVRLPAKQSRPVVAIRMRRRNEGRDSNPAPAIQPVPRVLPAHKGRFVAAVKAPGALGVVHRVEWAGLPPRGTAAALSLGNARGT
jgi:hypothetical protein